MSGQDINAWLDYKYEGDTEDIDNKDEYARRLREEKRYDYAWEREWNHLYD